MPTQQRGNVAQETVYTTNWRYVWADLDPNKAPTTTSLQGCLALLCSLRRLARERLEINNVTYRKRNSYRKLYLTEPRNVKTNPNFDYHNHVITTFCMHPHAHTSSGFNLASYIGALNLSSMYRSSLPVGHLIAWNWVNSASGLLQRLCL